MKDSDDSQKNPSAANRLVIRVRIVPEPDAPPPPRGLKPALIAAAIALALLVSGWIGFNAFRSEPHSLAAARGQVDNESLTPNTTSTPDTVAPATNGEPAPHSPASAVIEPQSQMDEPLVSNRASDSPTPIREVIPDAPVSALQTIRGTVRVSLRVTMDHHGQVIAVVTENPGPSRYFERLSLDAARQWTFTPGQSDETREVRLRFHFTRAGVTTLTEPLAPSAQVGTGVSK